MWSSLTSHGMYLMWGMQWLVELVPYLILAAAFEFGHNTRELSSFPIDNFFSSSSCRFFSVHCFLFWCVSK
jgi:hypothetical protein